MQLNVQASKRGRDPISLSFSKAPVSPPGRRGLGEEGSPAAAYYKEKATEGTGFSKKCPGEVESFETYFSERLPCDQGRFSPSSLQHGLQYRSKRITKGWLSQQHCSDGAVSLGEQLCGQLLTVGG